MKKEKLPQLKALMATTEVPMQALSTAIDARLKELTHAHGYHNGFS
jgi:hypothetical protein